MDSNRLLGDFLRARREATSLEDVGLPRTGQRRTPGLRREEVAMLAGVSTDYYIRLEQGRERRPSEQVLDALSRALELDAPATEHLYELARPRPRRQAYRVEQVSPGLARLLDGWRHTPAFISDRWLNVLATNAMADVLYAGLDHRDNFLRLLFLDPQAKQFYPDWEKSAQLKVALLRATAGRDPDDPVLPELVDELCGRSEEFDRMWARHDVSPRRDEPKRFHHRDVGEMIVSYESFTVDNAPGQQLVIFQAEPGSPSERAFALLAAQVEAERADVMADVRRAVASVGRRHL
ncbi:helix-turn-helix domain-containing protein [Microbispora sp. RL4-1S]|uniref:Helix-turn-helix domain-containing protein n=1 Tax=Microbispora oryzae TaxID=2806554 RepID=A0A941AS59_9ACTN|nr:helix-turn-helix transcriptional regulator [Microbispora oryzae]MBP2707444.1 helix-turn-helix domain-containing protein [Microbispora oryzae]